VYGGPSKYLYLSLVGRRAFNVENHCFKSPRSKKRLGATNLKEPKYSNCCSGLKNTEIIQNFAS